MKKIFIALFISLFCLVAVAQDDVKTRYEALVLKQQKYSDSFNDALDQTPDMFSREEKNEIILRNNYLVSILNQIPPAYMMCTLLQITSYCNDVEKDFAMARFEMDKLTKFYRRTQGEVEVSK